MPSSSSTQQDGNVVDGLDREKSGGSDSLALNDSQPSLGRSVLIQERVVGEDVADPGRATQVSFAPDVSTSNKDTTSRTQLSERKSESLSPKNQQKDRQCRLDLQTGRHIMRCQSVQRLSCQREAGELRWRRWANEALRRKRSKQGEGQPGTDWDECGPCGGEDEEGRAKRVYRIRSLYQPEYSKKQELVDDSNVSLLSEYIRWTFRASFVQVTFASYVEFLALIILFALFIWAVGVYQPECIFGGEFSSNLAPAFVDAFQLSWTTLSTVGFGIIAPNVNPTKSTGARCFGINILMAIEAFVGVLFAGVLAAILVGKVARVQSVAQVRFSDPICVRYGSGVLECLDDDEDQDFGITDAINENGEDSPTLTELPCPVLEFRIVNLLSEEKGGEIVNASIVVVATTLAEMDEAELKDTDVSSRMKTGSNPLLSPIAKGAGMAAGTAAKAAGMAAGATALVVGSAAKHTGAALFGAGKLASQATGTVFQRINNTVNRSHHRGFAPPGEDEEPEAVPYNSVELQRELERQIAERVKEQLEKEQYQLGGVSLKERLRKAVAVDEGNSTLVPSRVFHKLEIETDSHPFFRRVWNIRHKLDAGSPLLTSRARRAIAQNNGFWPAEWNDYASVRRQLRFTELIVSFSGTANVSGSSVYAQKVYDYADVNVGYAFAQLLHMSRSKKLVVDKRLLNDVLEQNGGGAEPFHDVLDDPADTFTSLAGEAHEATQQMAAQAAQTVQVAAGRTKDAANFAAERTAGLAAQTKAFVDDSRQRVLGGRSERSSSSGTGDVEGSGLSNIDVEVGEMPGDADEKKSHSP